MKRKVIPIILLFILVVVLSAHAARVFIFLHSKGTGTNPQEVFTQTVESQRCPTSYTYNSQSKACEADPVCPSGSIHENGTCVTSQTYLCAITSENYTSETACVFSCKSTELCSVGNQRGVYAWGYNDFGQTWQ